MKDTSPRMRVQAIRASETLYKAGDKSFADDYRALAKDADPNVVIQAMLSLNLFKVPDAPTSIKAAQAANKAQGRRADRRTAARAAGRPTFGGGRRGGALTPDAAEAAAAGQRRLRRRLLLVPRPGRHGRSRSPARAPGTTMAPPLAGRRACRATATT